MLHDAVKTIQNGFLFFFQKRTKTCFFKKKQINTLVVFSKKRVFLNPDCLSTLFVIFLDLTIWNKSRHYQFDLVCAAHL